MVPAVGGDPRHRLVWIAVHVLRPVLGFPEPATRRPTMRLNVIREASCSRGDLARHR